LVLCFFVLGFFLQLHHITFFRVCQGAKKKWKRGQFGSLPFWHGAPYTRSSLVAAAEHGATALSLNAADRRLLVEFIGGFGSGDISGEAERCRRYEKQFRDRFEAAAEDARRRGRSYVTLGLCAGGMAALLLGG
jgi:hypothetical protein